MFLIRLGLSLTALCVLAGCSVLHLGGNRSGVSIVAKNTYCGTPSQASEVHYFADPDDFQNWIDYRNVSSFNSTMARNGVLVVEMGQRPTGGYKLELDDKKTGIKNGVLSVGMDWHAPRLDAAVSQAPTSQCIALRLPQGQYQRVRVLDQLGNLRGTIDMRQQGTG